MALLANGQLYTWGSAASGQLGNGSTAGSVGYATANTPSGWLVNRPPTVALAISPASATGISRASFTLTATPADPDGNLSRVDFFENGTLVGSATSSPWQITRSNLAAGSYTYQAKAFDGPGLNATATRTAVVSDPVVSVAAQVPTTSESPSAPAVLRFSRTGGAGNLAVNYQVLGTSTATSGSDYLAIVSPVTIPDGSLFVDVPVTALMDAVVESNETVNVQILSGPGYSIAASPNHQATVTIEHAPLKTVVISGGDAQTGPANVFLPQAMEVLVRDASTSALAVNQPVVFTVQSGGGLLSSALSGQPLSTSVTVYTDTNGKARVYYQQGPRGAVASHIGVNGGQLASLSVTFTAATNALVAHWPLNETAGTTAADSSGATNPATVSTASYLSWGAGYVGNALRSAPGSTVGQTGLSAPNPNNRLIPPTGQPFTLAFWVRANQLIAGGWNAIACNETYLTNGFRLAIDPATAKVVFWTTQSGGTLNLLSTASITTARWYHVAVTYSGTVGKLYVDGALQASQTGTLLGNTNPLGFIGGIGGTYMLNGALDGVQVYQSELSATEIAAVRDSLTDGDALPDAWERQYFGDLSADPGADPDDDGLPNLGEYLASTHPLNPDTDGDSIGDLLDASDFDGDGLANGLDPNSALVDTDGDGYWDGVDSAPTNHLVFLPAPTPGDTIAPVITILRP
jgi:hypothetical protein